MTIRLEGIALLALCAFVLHQIHLLVHAPPVHPATPAELALGLAAALSGVAGAAMCLIGPALFRPYAWPPPDAD